MNDGSEILRGATPRPTVLLLHRLPDGTSHVDWMLAADQERRRQLITFRLPNRLDQLQPGQSLAIERMADHRQAYLEYEGPISGGRGGVQRLRRGEITSLEGDPDGLVVLEINWEPLPGSGVGMLWQRFGLNRTAENQWRVICVAAEG